MQPYPQQPAYQPETVPCYNIDGSTLKTMLRAHTGIVVLDDGVIADKRNCRDID
jgi:triosephosphate isomerase